jgi:hypothetical protein
MSENLLQGALALSIVIGVFAAVAAVRASVIAAEIRGYVDRLHLLYNDRNDTIWKRVRDEGDRLRALASALDMEEAQQGLIYVKGKPARGAKGRKA